MGASPHRRGVWSLAPDRRCLSSAASSARGLTPLPEQHRAGIRHPNPPAVEALLDALQEVAAEREGIIGALHPDPRAEGHRRIANADDPHLHGGLPMVPLLLGAIVQEVGMLHGLIPDDTNRLVGISIIADAEIEGLDRKSTRLNSSHSQNSYVVFFF